MKEIKTYTQSNRHHIWPVTTTLNRDEIKSLKDYSLFTNETETEFILYGECQDIEILKQVDYVLDTGDKV